VRSLKSSDSESSEGRDVVELVVEKVCVRVGGDGNGGVPHGFLQEAEIGTPGGGRPIGTQRTTPHPSARNLAPSHRQRAPTRGRLPTPHPHPRRQTKIAANGQDVEPRRLRRPTHSDGTSRLTLCPPNGVKAIRQGPPRGTPRCLRRSVPSCSIVAVAVRRAADLELVDSAVAAPPAVDPREACDDGAASRLDRPNTAARSSPRGCRTSPAGRMLSRTEPPGSPKLKPLKGNSSKQITRNSRRRPITVTARKLCALSNLTARIRVD
jgi:hypothetical protein